MIDVKHTLLPQQMQKLAAASLTRNVQNKDNKDSKISKLQSLPAEEIDVRVNAEGEYVIIRKDMAGGASTTRTKAVSESKTISKELLEKPSLYPILAKMGVKDTNQISAEIRNELLKLRSSGRHEGSLADWKHYYTTTGPTNFSSTNQIDFPLARIVGGTAVNTRTGATVSLRKCRIKVYIKRIPVSISSTLADTPPVLQMVYWRDKIPTTPGTVPVLWATDTNPPSSTVNMFVSLGNSASTAAALALRNPITEDAYHIYKVHEHILQMDEGYNISSSGGFGNAPPKVWIFEHTVDFHDVQQKYSSYATAQSDINDPYLTMRITNYSATSSFIDQYTVVTDTEFEDVQL